VNVVYENLSHSYGSVRALDGINITIGPGITGLLGPNGAGKTTMLRILATLLPPTSGTARLDGWSTSHDRERVEIRRRLGYLPQDLGLYPRFTVFEFVDYLAMLKELHDPRQRHRRVREALEAVDLQDVAGRKIRTLSGGIRRRVGIAQAIVADPQLLLLDEPTGGLDPEQRVRFRQLVGRLGEHRTILLSTHLVEDVSAICTSVVVLWHGRVLFQGAPAELRKRAEGLVWNAQEASSDAVASWRTDNGKLRVIGARPGPSATPVEPTLEDGYLLVTSGSPIR
jgi:ABC-2 type transport system ATP-binding protein